MVVVQVGRQPQALIVHDGRLRASWVGGLVRVGVSRRRLILVLNHRQTIVGHAHLTQLDSRRRQLLLLQHHLRARHEVSIGQTGRLYVESSWLLSAAKRRLQLTRTLFGKVQSRSFHLRIVRLFKFYLGLVHLFSRFLFLVCGTFFAQSNYSYIFINSSKV